MTVILSRPNVLIFLLLYSQELAKGGKKAFYEGRIADAIVEAVKRNGGVMTSQDLKNHVSTFETPINTVYKGVRLWEIPPNTQGIVALEALNILKGFNLKGNNVNFTTKCNCISFVTTSWYWLRQYLGTEHVTSHYLNQ